MDRQELVRTGVSVLVVLGVVGVWAYLSYLGQPVNPVYAGIVVLYALAAGYVVFGKAAWETARDTYAEVGGNSEDDGGGESSTE